MKTTNFLLLAGFVNFVLCTPVPNPVPSPFDMLTQSENDPEGANNVLHHMVNAESRVLHLVHPDGTTHAVTLTAAPIAAAAAHPGLSAGAYPVNAPVSNANTLHPYVNSHYSASVPDQHQFSSYTSSTNHNASEPVVIHSPSTVHVVDNTHPSLVDGNKNATSTEEHKALGGPLTPHNATSEHEGTPVEGKEEEPEHGKDAEKKAEEKKTEEKKSEGEGEKKVEEKKLEEKKPEEKKPEEKKPEEKKPEEKKPEGEEKKPEEKKSEEKKPEGGEKKPEDPKKPEEEKNSDATKKPEDDHANGSFANRDTIIMPLTSLVMAAGFALFIL